jgi:acyl transferase domain-containing protein
MPGPLRDTELLRQLMLEKYEPIAIVGIGLRLPGGNDEPGQFAEFLRAGRSGTGPIPGDRWDVARLSTDNPLEKGKVRTAGGGFLADIAAFDSRFFNISPREADYMDPQHRVVLEVAWHTLESANIDPAALRGGDGGVYIGVALMDYAIEATAVSPADMDAYIGTGTANSALPGRVSYFLGWRGPSMAIDTACSSSLVALHLAAQALRRRECDIALAGGVNLIHQPRFHIAFSQAGMLARDGRCKTFDDSADGYSRSEGCAVFALKRLSDAKADGDHIHALVRGSAVRQDGERSGLTVPNGVAQAMVMRDALASALLSPSDIGYVEAHGTGTSLGDPIEMGAIDSVFGASRAGRDPMIVGSVKTNIGHMEAAAGAGGALKAVLQLEQGMIFPHLNLEKPSRHIPWDRYRVKVATEAETWHGGTRRALVNSFGFAGTIASVVLEQAPPSPQPAGERPLSSRPAGERAGGQVGSGRAGSGQAPGEVPGEPSIFTLSAKTQAALRLQVLQYRRFLDDVPSSQLADLCYTANTGRAHLDARLARAVSSPAELAAVLDAYLARTPGDGARKGEPRGHATQVAFLCTGQGSQYPGMGRALYARYPVFRQHAGECRALFGALPSAPHQQALFTLEYAVARLWMSWGVTPAILLGHDIGEIVAATIAGLFSLSDAVRLVSALTRAGPPGTHPGPPGTHPRAAGATDGLRDVLAQIRFSEPAIAFVSGVTGEPADFAEVGTADYWVRQAAAPVRFAAGIRSITGRGRHVFLEVGPSAALTGLGRQCPGAAGQAWLPSLLPDDVDGRTIRTALACCYETGLAIDWAAYHRGTSCRKIALPLYAFDRKRHWLPAREPAADDRAPAGEPAGGARAPAPEPVPGVRAPAREPVPGVRAAPAREPVPDTRTAPPRAAAPLPGSVLAEYLRTSEAIVSAQQDVLLAFLGGQPGAGAGAAE